MEDSLLDQVMESRIGNWDETQDEPEGETESYEQRFGFDDDLSEPFGFDDDSFLVQWDDDPSPYDGNYSEL